MSSRDLLLLHPQLREKCLLFLQETTLANLHPLITCTGRTRMEQEALWYMGRYTTPVVNQKRLLAGLSAIRPDENRKVTWTMNSLHLIGEDGFCEAFDFCLTKNGKAYWDIKVSLDDDQIPDYQEAGAIAIACGLEWGGSWETKPDYPHCQLRRV